MVVAVRPLGRDMNEAIEAEEELHSRIMSLIKDPAFWAGHNRGLQQVENGETVSLEELEAKYG